MHPDMDGSGFPHALSAYAVRRARRAEAHLSAVPVAVLPAIAAPGRGSIARPAQLFCGWLPGLQVIVVQPVTYEHVSR